jgi:hypothetical protein
MLIYMTTPFLGLMRNYIKYKKFNIFLFIRTPIIYLFINLLFQNNNIWQILIYERWFFLIYKSLLSIYNNDYIKKKNKYIKKYDLIY